jgi:hypothetical protein
LIKEKILDEWENQLHRQCATPVFAAFDDEAYAREKKPGEETWVFLYIDERESSLLKPGYYFPEPVLGVTVIHKAEPYLFYFDSGNKIPEVLGELPKVGPNYKQVKHLADGGGIKNPPFKFIGAEYLVDKY